MVSTNQNQLVIFSSGKVFVCSEFHFESFHQIPSLLLILLFNCSRMPSFTSIYISERNGLSYSLLVLLSGKIAYALKVSAVYIGSSLPRSNAYARLRPCTIKYGRRDRISPYFNGIPGSVLRSYFSVSFTEGHDHFRIQAKFVFKTSLHTIAVQFVRNRSYTIRND